MTRSVLYAWRRWFLQKGDPKHLNLPPYLLVIFKDLPVPAICGNCFQRPQVKKCTTCRGIFKKGKKLGLSWAKLSSS